MAALATVRRIAARAASLPLARTVAVRGFAAKTEGDSTLSHADITKMFLELDAAAPVAATSDLPLKLTGRSGALVEALYTATKAKGGFDKVVKELEAFVAVVQSAGLVVDRFFTTTNYSPEECRLVLDLLLTTKEPLTSFAAIKNGDVKDLIVDNESNMDTWRAARKAVADLKLSDDVKRALEEVAGDGRLDLAKRMAAKAAELRSVTSKVVDVTVTSAVPLTKDQQGAVGKALPGYAAAGVSLSVNYVVDPAVLGGLLISIQNSIVDLSASSRLVEVVAAARGGAKMA